MPNLLLTLFFTLLFTNVFSQDCDYIKEKYSVRSTKNIFIGTELDYLGNIDSLFVDIYYPNGSTETARPLVMWVFGGGFIAGKREDFAAVCESCAKRGFVAATIDYRIGFTGTQIIAADSAEVLRAGFRGIQDGKSALRFLKSRHLLDSIDLNRVWVGGGSAGSIVALGTAFYDKEEHKPKEANAINSVSGRARPDLGPLEGTRYANLGFDTKVQGVFNIFGAVLNNNVFDSSDNIAVFSYHQTGDPVVPCGRNRPYWTIPFVSALYPIAYGSCEIEKTLNNLNFNSNYHKAWIYTGNEHAVHNENAVINFMLENANPILCNTVGLSNPKLTLQAVSIIPNPVQQSFIIDQLHSEAQYSIYSIDGKNIMNGKIYPKQELEIINLNSGFYILQLKIKDAIQNIRFTKID